MGCGMKRITYYIGTAYALFGGIVAVIFGASYFIGAMWAGGFSAMLSMPVFWLVWAIPLRGILWLPSLCFWYFSENELSVWQWLAPGLFTLQL